ncbi:Hypothetical protein, putative [Bodo saltans]|uniref:Uncharacterized protein n=1 Tax=Bodo saltans TaxID=75058 RepID=A0A0S4KM18_BODSA|nr:Hypothetical protein, putative [Bodo saltans]|eukprot:CUI14642.1 Hypothetical protein, putative [Bodo saltans]
MRPQNLQRRRSTITKRPSIAGFGPLSAGSFALDESAAALSSPSPRTNNSNTKPFANNNIIVAAPALKAVNAIKTCLLFKDPMDCLELTSNSLDPIDGGSISQNATKSCVHVHDDDVGSGKVIKITNRQQTLKFDVDACGDNLEGWTDSSPAGLLRELSESFCAGFNVGILHAGQRPDEDSLSHLAPFLFPRVTSSGGAFSSEFSRTVMTAFLEMSLKSLSISRSPPPSVLFFSASTSPSAPPPLSFEIMASIFAFAEGKVRDLTFGVPLGTFSFPACDFWWSLWH